MKLGRLDHVNVRTANLEAMTAWYRDVLGMTVGARPPFSFPGAWMYCGDQAAVHLVGVERAPEGREPRIEHFAFSATGLKEFMARLEQGNIRHEARKVPGVGIVAVNIWDPDGNHIHIDFTPEEAAAANI